MEFKNKAFLRKKVFLYLFLITIIICLIYLRKFYWIPVKDVVKVCGKVYYDDYKGGDISVFLRKELTLGRPKPYGKAVNINKVPGKYSIYVPRSLGKFYICAICININSDIENDSVAYFVSDLITIDPEKNEIRFDVHLAIRKRLMDYYKGPTVRISGRIIQENYTKGFIGVTVVSPENHKKVYLPPDINQIFLPHPGIYSIHVPTNIGEVYVNALNYPETDLYEIAGDKPGVIFSSYEENPINIDFSDIEGVDIILK